ncbi:MAG TPA: response regulator transcription factor [Spirochaetota bacterium]|nr:response regulator transcription factor [Spirochaetota bacterium]HPI22084.1 response regulator transcription factor [Spirochaetota bacterium]HPU87228.1 response regulator transcription factor [Spirochaetota bacterium]
MDRKILIIDDDAKLQDLLRAYLSDNGFAVASLFDGNEALSAIEKEGPDVVLLDIMLPGSNGLDVLRAVRATSSIPVIMLTAKGDDTDRIVGLELGADDYLPKPFNPRELLARIRAVMRRAPAPGVTPAHDDVAIIRAGGLVLNPALLALERGAERTALSKTEYRIMETLMRNPDRVFSRDDIMNAARGRDFIAFERSIDVHISKLRAKVESLTGERDRIKTVWGTGYLFRGDT